MTHDELLRRGAVLAAVLVTAGVAIAVTCLRGITGWRWS